MKTTEKMRKTEQFSLVYHDGLQKADNNLVLIMRPNGTDHNTLGVSVSKKVGNSVVRHRIKRLVKEIYRLDEESWMKGMDIVFVARSHASVCSFHELSKTVVNLRKKVESMMTGKGSGK